MTAPLYEAVSWETMLLSYTEKAVVVPGMFTAYRRHQEKNLFSIAMQMLQRVAFIYNNARGGPQGNVILFVINPSVRRPLQHEQALH